MCIKNNNYLVWLETQDDEGEWIDTLFYVTSAKDSDEAIENWSDYFKMEICQSQYDADNNTGEWNCLGDAIKFEII